MGCQLNISALLAHVGRTTCFGHSTLCGVFQNSTVTSQLLQLVPAKQVYAAGTSLCLLPLLLVV
jgi:hypothetical protein